MATKKKNLDALDKAADSANLQEKKVETDSTQSKEKKVKTIQLLVNWEEKIKAYHGGTVSGYITAAIQEKMRRDGIL